MRSGEKNLGALLGLLALLCLAGWARTDVTSHPYQPIFERNAFALKDPPPPQTNAPPPPPPAPLAKVVLTGITSIFGPSSKRALLEITEQEPGKPPSVKKPILREGEREGPVEVISIDVTNNTVLIRNGTVETSLDFAAAKAASAAPTGPTPPRGPGAIPALPTPNATPPGVPPAATASYEPNIIPRTPAGTLVDRTGIGLYGATPSTLSASPAVTARNTYANAGYGGYAGGATYNRGTLNTGSGLSAGLSSGTGQSTGSGLASVNTGLRAADTVVDTPRNIRSGAATERNAAVDALRTYVDMKANEEKAAASNIPWPSTPPLPGLE